ncbi:MAG: hypothetical protein KC656_17735, partial [Myxococcales bacterium]|nr:hypothetical protein [Myxococcales bacterium]
MTWFLLAACVDAPVPVEPEPQVSEAPEALPAVDLYVAYDGLADLPDVCDRLVGPADPPVGWTGSADTCQPGDLPAGFATRGMPLLDLARDLAGLPPVKVRAGGDAQSCALAMHANGAISHAPGADWDCVSDRVVTTAGRSLL